MIIYKMTRKLEPLHDKATMEDLPIRMELNKFETKATRYFPGLQIGSIPKDPEDHIPHHKYHKNTKGYLCVSAPTT